MYFELEPAGMCSAFNLSSQHSWEGRARRKTQSWGKATQVGEEAHKRGISGRERSMCVPGPVYLQRGKGEISPAAELFPELPLSALA